MSHGRKHDGRQEIPNDENNQNQNRNQQLVHQRQMINAISTNLRNIGDEFNNRYRAHNLHVGENFAQDIDVEEIVHHCVAIFFQLYRLFRQT